MKLSFSLGAPLLAAAMAVSLATACTKSQSAKKGDEPEALVAATTRDLTLGFTAQGVIRSEKRVEVRADRELKIAAVKVQDYQQVKRGDILVTIDTREATKSKDELTERKKTQDIQIRTARLRLRNAQKNQDRKRELLGKGIIPESEYEQAQQDYEAASTDVKTKDLDVAKLARELAELNSKIDAASFVAPIDGIVSELASGTGDAAGAAIGPGKLIAVVSDPSSVALWCRVSELYVNRLKVGATAIIRLDAQPNKAIAGKIAQIGANPTQSGGGPFKEYEVAVSFPSAGLDVREGFLGQIEFSFEQRKGVVAVPNAAIKYDGGRSLVLVQAKLGPDLEARPVEVGLKTETETEVISGLKAGERVSLK